MRKNKNGLVELPDTLEKIKEKVLSKPHGKKYLNGILKSLKGKSK